MIFWSVDSGKTFQGNCEEIKENTKRKDVFFEVLILGRLFKEIVKKLKDNIVTLSGSNYAAK